MFPHLGEIALILILVLLIFGVGRLPQISERIARGSQPSKTPKVPAEAPSSASKAQHTNLDDAQEIEDAEIL